ncbi:major facilitator superfamily domain-containing protein [Venturia nashicola]|uniref:Major facilitator superfamily domain-containing protein n=1 Tax=Venturia nashicola TaxID=86259 RepID=A0A4Z1PX47_9PEZI|nr:major facilitator superfamily domain-containing protein [Venturia nashicola]
MEEDWSDPAWPPGTVRLELLNTGSNAEIVLLPRPTLDPNDPLNWPKWRKYLNFGLACFYALMVFAQFNASSPTWGPLQTELGFSDAVLNDTWAIGCATLAIGSVVMIPFALKYGLRSIYILSTAATMLVMVWAAKTQTAGDWWGVNVLQCFLGSLAEVMVQITVADLFFIHQRGLMNSIYIWTAQTGSNLAPVAAGFITSSQGWRWVWWYFVIFFGITLVMFMFGFQESKFDWMAALQEETISPSSTPSVIIDGVDEKSYQDKPLKEEPLNKDPENIAEEKRPRNLSVIAIDTTIKRKTYWQTLSFVTTSAGDWSTFFRHTWQPFWILATVPGIAYSSCVYAVLLAWSTVMTSALSTYMLDPPYNFSSTSIGLMNLAPFIGTTLGSLICGPVSDWMVLRLARRKGGVYEPEMRLYCFVPFIPFQVAGAFWFGYALKQGQSWVCVAVAFGLCNFGSAPLQSIALTYITDAYNEIVGDALVSLTFVRNMLSTIFVFAMVPWVNAVGVANVFNTIGAIGLVVLLFSFAFIWKGKHWRYICARRYKFFAARQFEPRPVKN